MSKGRFTVFFAVSLLLGALFGSSVGVRYVPSAMAQECDWCMGTEEYCCPSRLNPIGCANAGCISYGINRKICLFYAVENGADCTAKTDCEACLH
jgi:hypothetical protein